MITEQNASLPIIEKPTLGQLWQDIKKHKKLYYKVLGFTFIVSAILLIGTPNYYKCTVKLAPELSGSKSTSSLTSIASSFGLNIGSGNMGSEALFPTLYPDLMNSVAFRASLFPIKVQREDDDTPMTYYDYLNNEQKKSLLEYAVLPLKLCMDYVASLIIPDDEDDSGKVNPFMLTKEQFATVEDMEKTIVCDVDNKTLVITIDVIDQDPLIAATMADSVQMHLQEFITDYRTRKARIDLLYNQKIFKEAKERYEKARQRSAAYNDANQKVFLDRVRSEQTKLANEMNLEFQAYSQVAAQLRMAEAKVQEDTPAFTTLQPATVPIKKAGPKRVLLCFLFLVLSFIIVTIIIFDEENRLSSLFNLLQKNDRNRQFDGNEDLFVLSKYQSKSND